MKNQFKNISGLTTISICFDYLVIALIFSNYYYLTISLIVSIGFIFLLNYQKSYLKFFLKLIIPNLSIIIIFSFIAEQLQRNYVIESWSSQPAYAFVLSLKLWIFATAMYTIVISGQHISYVLEMEARGLSPFISYIIGKSLSSPSMLLNDVNEIISGFKGRGLLRTRDSFQIIMNLSTISLTFVRVAFSRIDSRALSLYQRNYFGISKTKRPKPPEKPWEPGLRYILILATVVVILIGIL